MKIKIVVVIFDLFVYRDAIKYIKSLMNFKNVCFDYEIFIPLRKKDDFLFESCNVSLYDDKYFDYSAYALGMNKIEEYDGFLFINDTFFLKNFTRRNKEFLFNFLGIENSSVDFPLMIGPFHKPYIGMDDFIHAEFIPTYYFYLNKPAVLIFKKILDDKEIFLDKVKFEDKYLSINRYMKFFMLQIQKRYNDKKILDKKIATSLMEYKLCSDIKRKGLLIYTNSSISGQLQFLIDSHLNKFLIRLKRFLSSIFK